MISCATNCHLLRRIEARNLHARVPYLHASVEEAEREEEFLVHGRGTGDVQLVVVQLVVRALQVGLVTMRMMMMVEMVS